MLHDGKHLPQACTCSCNSNSGSPHAARCMVSKKAAPIVDSSLRFSMSQLLVVHNMQPSMQPTIVQYSSSIICSQVCGQVCSQLQQLKHRAKNLHNITHAAMRQGSSPISVCTAVWQCNRPLTGCAEELHILHNLTQILTPC